VRAWGALSATATFYSATCIVYTFVITRIVALGTTIAQQACSSVHVVNILPYNQSCWCQVVLLTTPQLRQRTMMNANHHDGWTQKFQTSKWTSRSLNVTRNGAIQWGSSTNDCWRQKTRVPGLHVALFAYSYTFSRFDTIPACDRQTQTDRHTMTANTCASLASRG